ncbi:hypothetical protein GCM10023319_24200 [Nocardia iowensis]
MREPTHRGRQRLDRARPQHGPVALFGDGLGQPVRHELRAGDIEVAGQFVAYRHHRLGPRFRVRGTGSPGLGMRAEPRAVGVRQSIARIPFARFQRPVVRGEPHRVRLTRRMRFQEAAGQGHPRDIGQLAQRFAHHPQRITQVEPLGEFLHVATIADPLSSRWTAIGMRGDLLEVLDHLA